MAEPAVLERKSTNPFLTRGLSQTALKSAEAGFDTGATGPITEGRAISDPWAATGALGFLFMVMFAAGWWMVGVAPFVPFVAIFVGLGLVFWAVARPEKSPVLAPLYAVAEGLFVGGISRVYEAAYDGIVLQASLITAVLFTTMWVLYSSGRLRLTPKMTKAIVGATMGILGVYVIDLLLRLFGAEVPLLNDTGPLGIGISLVIVGIATMNLLIDFDLISRLEAQPHPRYMDWFAAMGVLITVVWIYLEVLRLLSKMQRR